MTSKDFVLETYSREPEKGQFTWSSPSNIALVKYWGKVENQIPTNPSISFTLNKCRTITTLKFRPKSSKQSYSFDIFLNGEKKDSFKPKIETFFERVEAYVPFVKDYHFTIHTKNTFPHSSGIASSASGMSALALCLMSLETSLTQNKSEECFLNKASFLARLGSGSACRSIENELVVWGKHTLIKDSSNLFGVRYPFKLHDNFKNYQDTILLVDVGEKQVSSSIGHGLMKNHAFAESRFEQASENLTNLISIFEAGDLSSFINIVESEALTLHAMMMTSNPYFILMKPNTLKIINEIWEFRMSSGLHLCFTLDAGANVHLLYPSSEQEAISKFINERLTQYCHNGKYITDMVGSGAFLVE